MKERKNKRKKEKTQSSLKGKKEEWKNTVFKKRKKERKKGRTLCDITEQQIKTDGHRKDLALRQIDCEDKLEMKKGRRKRKYFFRLL